MMGRRIWQMVKKEFVQVWRDRRLRIFLFLPPIIQLNVYGYAINFDIKQVPFAVFDEDRTQVSQSLISRFTASEYFRLAGFINEPTLVVTVSDVSGHNPIDGECLQILREFGRDAKILLVGEDQSLVRTTLVELLPDSFGPEAL